MGIPLQFSKAKLKKDRQDQEPEENKDEASSESPEREQEPFPPKDEGLCEEPCEEPCELPKEMPDLCMLPDFCGLFDKAMQPFCSQPGININITIDMSKTKDDGCDEKEQPHSVSFLRD